MAFLANPTPPQFQRVIRAATIRASRGSRRWLKVFLLVAFLLVVGVVAIVLPLARVVITPVVESVPVKGSVRVDVDSRTVVRETGVIPGQVMGTGDSIGMALRGSATVRLVGAIATYTRSDADAVVAYAAAQAVGDDYVAVEPLPPVTWDEKEATPSGRGAVMPFHLNVRRHRRFPISSWHANVTGQSLDKARAWLAVQPGVVQVSISVYPGFLAKISPKLPKIQSAIRFSLDIDGKTSILE